MEPGFGENQGYSCVCVCVFLYFNFKKDIFFKGLLWIGFKCQVRITISVEDKCVIFVLCTEYILEWCDKKCTHISTFHFPPLKEDNCIYESSTMSLGSLFYCSRCLWNISAHEGLCSSCAQIKPLQNVNTIYLKHFPWMLLAVWSLYYFRHSGALSVMQMSDCRHAHSDSANILTFIQRV